MSHADTQLENEQLPRGGRTSGRGATRGDTLKSAGESGARKLDFLGIDEAEALFPGPWLPRANLGSCDKSYRNLLNEYRIGVQNV